MTEATDITTIELHILLFYCREGGGTCDLSITTNVGSLRKLAFTRHAQYLKANAKTQQIHKMVVHAINGCMDYSNIILQAE